MKKLERIHAGTKSRRKDIIDAALACFSEDGFTETGMSDICKRAGASTGSVYHHFKSKEQLATAVYIEGINEYQAGLLENLEKEEGGFEGIRGIIRFHLEWVEKNRDWANFLFQQRHAVFMSGTDEEFDAMNRSFIAGISEWFAFHVKEGAIRKMKWDLYVAILLGPCQEFSRIYLSGQNSSTVDEAVEELALSAWSSIKVK